VKKFHFIGEVFQMKLLLFMGEAFVKSNVTFIGMIIEKYQLLALFGLTGLSQVMDCTLHAFGQCGNVECEI